MANPLIRRARTAGSFSPWVATVAVSMAGASSAWAQTPAAAPDTLPAVTVEGDAVTSRTEGTHAYTTGQTTAATGLPLALRDTPQSVTVLTRQRMEDQQLNSVQAALEATTGISSVTLDTERVSFYSRGFAIDSFQYDGVPTTFVTGASFLDTAFYDRIEVVRGAAGLLTGAGNPSASVNLVRKRPTKDFSATVTASAGSWSNYRSTVDVSTPLTADGRIRARVVGVAQDRHSYIDLYRQKKNAFYGVVEADITRDTILTAGYDYQDIAPRGTTWGGVPQWFSDGSTTDWARSKTLAADWSRWDNTQKTAFAQLDHRFDNGWKAHAALTRQRTDSESRLFSALGYPDRSTGLGLIPVALADNTRTRQTSADAMASGPFELFGRRHELVVGAMASQRNADDNSTGFVFPTTAVGNFYQWTGSYPEPDFGAAGYALTRTRTRQSGIYGAARLALADRWKMIVGGRLSNYQVDETSSAAPFHYKKTNTFTPYVGVIHDLSDTYSVYASYTEIFNPQTYRDRNNQVLAPTTGKNKEAGLKGEYLDGRLNASVSVFETLQDNVAQTDTGHLLSDGTQAYYGANGTKSRGFDVDLQGAPARGWNVYAGLSHFTASDASGARLSTQLPRTTLRLFSTYRLPGVWSQLTVGGGVTWQSRFYQSATSPAGTVDAQQKSYGLVSLMARYAVTPKMDVAFNVNNLFDKKYSVMSGFYNQVLSGEPRSAMVTLTYRL